MGIKNLHRFLKKNSESAYKEVHLSHYANKTIAIDVNIYLFKYKSIHKDRWMNVFLSFILVLKKYNIQCVFIYDTKAPIEKNARKEERKQRKRRAERKIREIQTAITEYDDHGVVQPILRDISDKRGMKKLLKQSAVAVDREAIQKELSCLENQIVNLSKHELALSKKMLNLLGIPYYDSETEAETLCAYMCCHGLVDAVLSDDTDVLVYGTPVFMTKLNMKTETCFELRFDEIIRLLNLSRGQFTDLCIMSGTDYNDNIPNIGNEKSYKLLQKFSSIENIGLEKKELDISILNHRRVREIFSVPEIMHEYDLENKSPQIEEFKEFVYNHHVQMNSTRIDIIKDMVKNVQLRNSNKYGGDILRNRVPYEPEGKYCCPDEKKELDIMKSKIKNETPVCVSGIFEG